MDVAILIGGECKIAGGSRGPPQEIWRCQMLSDEF